MPDHRRNMEIQLQRKKELLSKNSANNANMKNTNKNTSHHYQKEL
jgi:hypothetical protein